MKFKKLRVVIACLLTLTLLIGAFAVKYDLVSKVRHIGNSPTEAVFNLYQILRKEGVKNTVKAIVTKLENDPRLGLKYSLYDKSSYPPVESFEERAALPEYKVIPAVDVGTLPSSRDSGQRYDTWHRSNGDDFSSKYSSHDQIRRNNVRELEVAWTYTSGPYRFDANMIGAPVESNPVIVNGKLFVASIDNHLISMDAATGRELWRLKLPPPVARRGMIWEPNPDFSKSRLFVPTGRGVFAVNPARGEILRDFGNDGEVGDQLSLIAPVIAGDKLIVALIKPALEAYDLRSGKRIWSRPLLGKPVASNALLTGGVPWSGMSFDPSRSRVYVSNGNPRPELWGTSRPGANRHSCSVVAIDTESGEIIWAFQEVAHDLWDMDVTGPPVLTTITKGGKRVDVVAVVTKAGNTLLLDRDFGKPIFDYRLQRAPVSSIPGEQTWPYQPALELPEPFLKQAFEESDVTDISASARRAVRQKIRSAKFGFFEPPILGGTIVLYGTGGGAEWPGAAVDPKTGILYIPSEQRPWVIRANYRDLKASSRATQSVPGDAAYQAKCAGCHGAKRDGFQEIDSKGGLYYPALTAITAMRSRDVLISTRSFSESHAGLKLNSDVTSKDLEVLFEYFSSLDKITDKDKSFTARTWWGGLTDSEGNPGTKPPWGFMTALDLNSGKKVWQIPFGEYQKLRRNGAPVKGQQNVGGAIVTAGGLVFATGTIDGKVRAFDSSSGRELWSSDLPAAGSAPPSTYLVDGVQYVVVVASDRPRDPTVDRFDKVVAFRLPGGRRK